MSSNQRQIAIPRKLSKLLSKQISGKHITKLEADKCGLLAREVLKHANRKDLYKNFVNMGTEKLITLLGRSSYLNIVNHLIDSNVIIRTDSYYAGNGADMGVDTFPKAVTLLDEYNSQEDCELWELSTKHSIEAISKSYKIRTRSKVAANLAEMLKEFDVDTTDCTGKEKYMRCKWTLENINSVNQRNFFMTEDKFSGRLHTNFTQMNSAARKQIFTIEGKQPVKSLDVSSMAPLLIGWIVRDKVNNNFLELNGGMEGGREGEGDLVFSECNHINKLSHSNTDTSYSAPLSRNLHSVSTMFTGISLIKKIPIQSNTPQIITPYNDFLSSTPKKSAQKNANSPNPAILSHTNPNVEAWIRLCESGDLYERIRSLIPTTAQRFRYCDVRTRNSFVIDLSKLSPKAFKKQVLTVIYDRNENSIRNPVWTAIQNRFPEIADFIYQTKLEDHTKMSQVTQGNERKIMIDDIGREHFKQGLPAVTIHDEIITATPIDTRKIMKAKFANIGLNPNIK